MKNTKVFIIGLPRTGTTSVCICLLDLGYTVAHTAYTKPCIEQAQVIADVPVFAFFKELDRAFPNSKFVYLDRNKTHWIPSVTRLLERMKKNLITKDGGFFPLLKESYFHTFKTLNRDFDLSPDNLLNSYNEHKNNVYTYFENRQNDLLTIDISCPNSYFKITDFLGLDSSNSQFPWVNKHNKITYWKSISHPLKINSTLLIKNKNNSIGSHKELKI